MSELREMRGNEAEGTHGLLIAVEMQRISDRTAIDTRTYNTRPSQSIDR